MVRVFAMADLAWWLRAHPGASPWDWSEKVIEDPEGQPQFLRFVEGVVSFDQDQTGEWVGLDRYREAVSDACDVAQSAGVDGGFRVPHPYRVSNQGKDKLAEAGYGKWGEEGSYWDGVREDPYDVGWHRYVEPGMHTHFIGWSGQRGTTDATLNGPDAGLLKRFSKDHRDSGDPDTFRELYVACRYPLTHAAPPEDAPRVSNRFGDAHGAAKKRPENLIEEINEGEKGPDLLEQCELAVDFVLEHTIEDYERDSDMTCPQCEGDDWVSIWDSRDLCEADDAGEIDLEHRDSLDVARALKHHGPDSSIPIAKSVERGFLDREPDGSLPEVDLSDPEDVRRLLGLPVEAEDAGDAPVTDDGPAEPPPGGSVDPPGDARQNQVGDLFGRWDPENWRYAPSQTNRSEGETRD